MVPGTVIGPYRYSTVENFLETCKEVALAPQKVSVRKVKEGDVLDVSVFSRIEWDRCMIMYPKDPERMPHMGHLRRSLRQKMDMESETGSEGR